MHDGLWKGLLLGLCLLAAGVVSAAEPANDGQVRARLEGVLAAVDGLDATARLGAALGTAGVFGLALGFALRDTIENYLAGVLLSLRQPFSRYDHVALEGHEGQVLRLTSRAAILLTFDGNHVRIPNLNEAAPKE